MMRIQTPRPYPLQNEILKHPAKFKVICAGRRAGKTFLAAKAAIDRFKEGRRVVLSSTSQKQADTFFRYINIWLREPIKDKTIIRNKVKRTFEFAEDFELAGHIQVQTASDPNSFRSDACDLLVLDECAYLHPDTWEAAGMPLLTDTDGDAIFISTPARRNWFFRKFVEASDPENADWHAWQFPSTANPHLPPDALARLTANMTDEMYRQEILAQFLESDGAVFRYIDERSTAEPAEPYAGDFVMGVDWAQKRDYTAIVIIDVNAWRVVAYDRFRGVDWNLQRGRLRALYDAWQPENILAEENSIGGPNIEELQREGLPVQPFTTTSKSKPALIESLVLAFDRGEITSLNDDVMKAELAAYERTITPTGRSQYSAPEGLHDDCVIALALAWYATINRATRLVRDSHFF